MFLPPPQYETEFVHNIYDVATVAELTARINRLTPSTMPQWGKMSVDQMLAHCNVSYDMAYTDLYPKVGGIRRFLLDLFVKQAVVGPKPYPRNSECSRPRWAISTSAREDPRRRSSAGCRRPGW